MMSPRRLVCRALVTTPWLCNLSDIMYPRTQSYMSTKVLTNVLTVEKNKSSNWKIEHAVHYETQDFSHWAMVQAVKGWKIRVGYSYKSCLTRKERKGGEGAINHSADYTVHLSPTRMEYNQPQCKQRDHKVIYCSALFQAFPCQLFNKIEQFKKLRERDNPLQCRDNPSHSAI